MSLFTFPIRTARRGALLLVPLGLMVGCTDLTENPPSLITKDSFYKTAGEVNAGVTSVYANIRQTVEEHYQFSQVSSDETVVPVRGSDWFDNGTWLEMHRQGWSPNSLVSNREGTGIWNAMYTGVARANIVLEALDAVDVPGEAATRAELRALRALFYTRLLDTYGGVPIATSTVVENRARATADSTFRFIESELRAAAPDLPRQWPSGEYGRMTRGAVHAMLASLYLNARVYSGTPTANGLQPGTARWADAAAFADSVLNQTQYSLSSNPKAPFLPGNQSNTENILVVRYSNIDGLGMDRQFQSLHYNSVATGDGGWNGFSVVADTYRLFDADDIRRTQILVGPQVGAFSGQPVFERGRPTVRLNFTVDIGNILEAAENEGARIYKYPFDPARANGRFSGNDFVLFRLAEMYLIKAEAQNELNNQAGAAAQLNTVRARSFTPFTAAKQISPTLSQAAMRTAIFNERLYELVGEGKRRTDQIRAGTFNSGTWFGKTPTPGFRYLLPIPISQMNANPLLVQNPGY
jgi:starch-binding outer membrane protein, SusD/RagB family